MKCSEVNFQEYTCCYHIYLPWKCKFAWEPEEDAHPKLVSVDKCLLPELITLWELGIRTTGCCCGHGKSEPYIGVRFEDIEKMKELGYKVFSNHLRPKDEDSFIPKTKLSYEYAKCTDV